MRNRERTRSPCRFPRWLKTTRGCWWGDQPRCWQDLLSIGLPPQRERRYASKAGSRWSCPTLPRPVVSPRRLAVFVAAVLAVIAPLTAASFIKAPYAGLLVPSPTILVSLMSTSDWYVYPSKQTIKSPSANIDVGFTRSSLRPDKEDSVH